MNPLPPTNPRLHQALLAGAHLVIALLAIYSLAFATHFTFRFAHLAYMDHYRFMANGFAHLHTYGCDDNGTPLPPGCIDCINYYGKVYYPYGPFPAIFQLFLNHLLGLHVTTEALVWLLCVLSLYVAFWGARWYAQRVLELTAAAATICATAFAAVIGTSNIFLHVSTVAYSWTESSATGQLLNLTAAFLLMRSLYTRRYQGILWAGILCGFSFLSKQSYILAVVPGVALLLWTGWRSKWPLRSTVTRAVVFALPMVICVAAFLWYDYVRFGSPFETGFQYFNGSEKHPEPFQMPQPHRIPYNLYNHFLSGIQIRTSDFPFVLGKSSDFGGMNRKDGSGGLLHNIPMFSVFISIPMLLAVIPALIFVGSGLARKQLPAQWELWVFIFLLWCCAFAYFLNESGSFVRYEYDMPFLLGLCAFQAIILGWRAIGRISRPTLNLAARACFIAFLIASFVEQAAIGMDQTAGLILTRTNKFVHWAAVERPSDGPLRDRAQAVRAALFDDAPPCTTTAHQ